MKTRVLISSLLAIVVSHVRAGDLSIVGNVNVTSNLTANGCNLTGPLAIYDGDDPYCCAGFISAKAYATQYAVLKFDIGGGFEQKLQLNPGGGPVMINTDTYFLDYGGLSVGNDAWITGYLEVDGKIHANGGIDPPYLLLDSETRSSIANRVAREVPPSKRSGAALFWNSQTKRLEIYVASEGAFYDLNGKILAALGPPAIEGATVTRTFRIDPQTGTVVTRETLRVPRWQLKAGYRFDSRTGVFTRVGDDTNAVPVRVTAREALELK